MSEEPEVSLAELAARVLRRAEAEDVAIHDDQRAAHLALLASTIREERARVVRRRWISGLAALAATGVAALGLRAVVAESSGAPVAASSLAHSPSFATSPRALAATRYDVTVEGEGAEIVRAAGTSAAPSSALRAGDRVQGDAASVSVVVATGTKLRLDPSSALSVVEVGPAQIFALRAGNMNADVAKLQEGERFVVRTSDTEVEVRGTSFRVENLDVGPSCRPELHTRVVVREGVVVVRHAGVEDRVAAGEQWPAPCAPSSAAAPSARSSASSPPSVAMPAPSAVSSLAAANELFERAQNASKRGDPRGAVVLFDRLVVEHPKTPLVEHATVERMRALDQFDRARSVAAARDYLARYPSGFARAEAEAIVALAP
ncbi:MAG: hypothetical protein JWP87_1569 [Labilithrix sp.]|nr:hypothetical protein [Labilithrix sp.]